MSPREVDAVVVGAGFAGLYAVYRLREQGLSVQGIEAGGGVGGTWYWNCYPGARCDVESMEYSYSFSAELEREWAWTERYAAQPEILRYLAHVAARFDLTRHFHFGTRVTGAQFDAASGRWQVATDGGEGWAARFLVMATGCLSESRLPDIPGLAQFEGTVLRTSRWPREGADLADQRVGVIGTGSTGIQCIPQLARSAARLTVFQRTPNFSVPAANAPLDAATREAVIARYPQIRHVQRTCFSSFGIGDAPPVSALQEPAATREARYRAAWERGGISFLFTYNDLILDRDANETAAAFVRDRIREMVSDPAVADRLMPRDYPIGTKRLCLDTAYYGTYNLAHVELVDLRSSPIERITPAGIRLEGGREVPLDALVFATGFDAVTGALLATDLRGRSGQPLAAAWKHGPSMYLGLMAAGFPNLFAITGPGSPSVLSNMVVSIEQHVDFVASLIARARALGRYIIEADADAEQHWMTHVAEVAGGTLYPEAASWYMGANIPGKPRVFLPYVGGVGPFRRQCDEIAAAGYRGFSFS
jgi:cyclohexanone monooxygenase